MSNTSTYLAGAPGRIRVFTGSNPSPGANLVLAVPTGRMSRLLWFGCTIACDANSASRLPVLRANDGSNDYFDSMGGGFITANLTFEYIWGIDMHSFNATPTVTQVQAPVPSQFKLLSTDTIRLDITNIQVGDQISGIVYVLETWII